MPNANPEAKLLAFEGKDIRFYNPREDYRGHMILMSGLPAPARMPWLRRNCPDTPVVSLDALREEMEVDPADQQGPVMRPLGRRCGRTYAKAPLLRLTPPM